MSRPTETSTDDMKELFEESPSEPRNASEVANKLGCSDETAWKRLEECWEMGLLHRKTFSQRFVVYYVCPDELD